MFSCWITRHLYPDCRHFRESFASRIEAKFGAGFSAKETKSKLPNTMMKHRKIHTPHKFGRLFFVGSKRLRFHEWETALLLLHFVRASSKTMEELDGVGCKVLQLQILGKLFVWKKKRQAFVVWVETTNQASFTKAFVNTLIAFLLTSQRNHVELFFGIWDAPWDVVPESVAHVIVCVFLLAAKEKWKVWKKIELQEDSSHNKKLLSVSF